MIIARHNIRSKSLLNDDVMDIGRYEEGEEREPAPL